MINVDFACYLVFVCVHWVLFSSCCLAQKEAKVCVCCSVSFILPPVQAIPWWQLTEVPQDAGPQFYFHFTVCAYGVDGGSREMMLHWRLQTTLHHLLCRSEACSTSSWSMGWEAWVAKFLALHSWLLWLSGRCGMRSIWAVQGLLPPAWVCSPRAVAAASLSLRAAASWGGKLEVEAGSSPLPMRQLQNLSGAAAVWIPDHWEEERGGRTVFSLPSREEVWEQANERPKFLSKI